MVNAKKKSLLCAYLANVPFHMSVLGNFFAGAICRLMSAMFLSQGSGAIDIFLYAAAVLFIFASINVTTYIMCSAFLGKERRRPAASTMLAGIFTAFAAGAALAPYIISLASHG